MNLDFSVRDIEYYLDNAATTVMAEEVTEAMQPFLEERYGNAESPYFLGQEAQSAVADARESIARQLGCTPEEVFFTSGGTESNNWAIKCADLSGKKYTLCSAVEHSSVLESIRHPANGGLPMDGIPVDGDGTVSMKDLKLCLTEHDDIGLLSIQFGNNEVGTIQPIKEIAALCKANGVVFHCDACQAFGKVPIDVNELGVDLMSISAHKIHGPMGIGALYVRSGTPLNPLMHGGGHEGGMRSGTLNVPAIVGFGVAAELAWSAMKKEMPRIAALLDDAGNTIELSCGVKRNGSDDRLPHILSLTLPDVDASVVVGALAERGMCISAGSACSPKGRSHVLSAMGHDLAQSDGTIRVSLSRYSKKDDILAFSSSLSAAIKQAQGLEML